MKKFFRRVSAAVVALAVMVTAFVFDVPKNMVAAADGTEHTNHCVCGETGCSHSGHQVITDWQAINDENGLKTMENGKHYYLSADITITDAIQIANDAEITLCLNGHKITQTGQKVVFRIGTSLLGTNAVLNLCDCSSGKTGTLTGANYSAGCVHDLGTFNMYGGIITGNTTTGHGGGVCVSGKNTFNMYGGTISGNTAQKNGGGVSVSSDGTFNMHGGTISDNTALENGGGVYNSNKFYMFDGTITNNAAKNGGGLCEWSGSNIEFIMSGGEISDNIAQESGGGVFNYYIIKLNGKVTIKGNKSGTDGALTDDDIHFRSGGRYLNIGENFSTDFPISVSTQNAPTPGTPIYFAYSEKNNLSSFKPGKDGYKVIYSGKWLWLLVIPSEKCGENATWKYDEDTKTLTVSGTGAMDDWLDSDHIPWAGIAEIIENVVIENEITSVGNNAFKDCTGLKEVIYPDSATVGTDAIPGTSAQVKYSLTTADKMKITDITLGSGGEKVTIPNKINGKTVTEVKKDDRPKVSRTGHDHIGDTPAESGDGKSVCDICGADYVKPGKIEAVVQAHENVPKPQISTSEVIDTVLTDDEKEEINNGKDIKIILKIENAAESAPSEDKTAVTSELGKMSEYKLGLYLDVTLLKKIGEQAEEKITQTSKLIKVTFEIPSALRGKAEYSVIRVHDGAATVLKDLDTDPNTVTIETDRFSTYALTYKEKASDGGSGGGSSSDGESSDPQNPSTNDTSDDTSSNTSDNTSDNASSETSDTSNSTDTTSDSGSLSGNTGGRDDNPTTGVSAAVVPVIAMTAAVIVSMTKRRNNK